jgi:hypothetical protein
VVYPPGRRFGNLVKRDCEVCEVDPDPETAGAVF